MKERLDILVSQQTGMSREKAKTTIMAGLVFVDNQRVDKAGTKIDVTASIEVKGNPIPYVGRGGLKLEKALQVFPLSLEGKVMMDIGASTGGFTDCGLQNGVRKVYAVDVGYGQLAWKLRTDPRVVNMERCNIKQVEPDQLGELADFVSIDVSFISLGKILDALLPLIHKGSEIVALIKPQFEAGREHVGKGGIVRDKAVHIEVICRVVEEMKEKKLTPLGLTYSPIKGADGNIEFLLYLRYKEEEQEPINENRILEVVEEAHQM